MIDGDAVHVTDDSRLRTLTDLWRRKYHGDWDFAVERGMFVMRTAVPRFRRPSPDT